MAPKRREPLDPALLQPLLAEPDTLVNRLVAVDGTFLRVVGELLWTLRQRADSPPPHSHQHPRSAAASTGGPPACAHSSKKTSPNSHPPDKSQSPAIVTGFFKKNWLDGGRYCPHGRGSAGIVNPDPCQKPTYPCDRLS